MSKTTDRGPFRFFDLPPALRGMVYEEYFTPKTWVKEIKLEFDDDEQCFHPQNCLFFTEDPVESSMALVRETLPSALLRTSRAIFSEAKQFHDKAFKKHITDQVATIKIHNPRRYTIWDLGSVIETKWDAHSALFRYSPHASDRLSVDRARQSLTFPFLDPNRDVTLAWSLQSAYQMLNNDDNDVVRLQLSWDDGTSHYTKLRTENIVKHGCHPSAVIVEYV